MSTTSSQAYYHPSAAIPINMPAKSPYYATHQQNQYRLPAASPPEVPASSTTSGPSHLYTNSAASSSYAGSAAGEYCAPNGVPMSPSNGGIDLVALLSERLTGAFDPIPLDRSLANQAQTSGALNAKHRELLELQQQAQRRLAATRANFADGMKAAKEVKRDLEWTQKHVDALKQKAEKKYPVEYHMAKDRYPIPADF